MAEQTPLMIQYQSIKENYPNEVLFFRLGDFYEMFNDDAVEVSRLLNLTLTHRGPSPMCGIPYHASKIYIARLLRLGKKIAICEQVGEPKAKGLTERKVVEIITPGSVTEEEYLEYGSNNFLAAICFVKENRATKVSFSYIDISTGNFYATHWDKSEFSDYFFKEIARCSPKEILVASSVAELPEFLQIKNLYPNISISTYPDWHFSQELTTNKLKKQFNTVTLRSFSLTENSPENCTAGFLIEYLIKNSALKNENGILPHVTSINVYKDSQFVIIDDSSRRNLEITSNLRDGSSAFSLLETVQFTNTAMGKRLLSTWFMYPLTDYNQIVSRQNHVQIFYDNPIGLSGIREILSKILDIERLTSRIALEKAHPKDVQALRTSLESAVNIQKIVSELSFPIVQMETANQIINLIANAILDDPSTSLTEGRIIKEGFSEELDRLRNIQKNFNQILDEYLETEKKQTGITTLKIKYNRINGYYMEVSKGKLSNVPSHFILRRALVNGDRYTTSKLQELEDELVKADEKIIQLEKQLFLQVRNEIANHIQYLLQLSSVIAYIDVCASLAHSAKSQNWCRPEIVQDDVLYIEKGRHPVVEFHMATGEFVPNDVNLSEKKFALITGPNMAGKSTYLRQNALITLLAQIGSFVPAQKAKIGIVDRIFCRVGASDNLARGESTFLVEMSETALILRSATEKSLVIMDEVGRGTSTEDGLSLAWAISEYLLHTIKSKTLFATHYHQLTRMEHPVLQMLCMDVLESDGKIIFLRKVIQGSAQNSYGLHVAQLAGIPLSVVDRAQAILETIVKNSNIYTDSNSDLGIYTQKEKSKTTKQLSVSTNLPGLFSDEEMIIDSILSTDVNSITPIEALSKIAEWKKLLSTK